jgi:hypothetical protein
LAYQWQSAAAATGPWTNITGATTGLASVSQTVDTWYRCEVTCTPSSTTAASTPVQVTTLPNLAAGTYTIGAGGSYPTFTAAFAAAACGVAGPVVFQVITSSPTFTEQLVINEIPGLSATNTITVKGNFNTLSFAATDNNVRHTLHLNGADYLRFEDLTIEAIGATSGWAVRMSNNANHNTFKRCVIRTNETLTSSLFAAFTLTQSPTAATGTQSGTASNLLIDSCQIVGGYWGLCLNGNGITMGLRPSNNTVRNSTVSNFYLYGIYAYGQNDLVIEYNDINRLSRSTMSTCYGIYNYGRSPGMRMVANRIHDLGGISGTATFSAYPLYCSTTSGTALSPVLVANNAIYNINNLGGIVYAMYMLSTDTLNVLHNTIDINSNSGSTTAAVYGAFISGNMNQVTFKNNIIQIGSSGTGAKYGLYNSSTTALINSDHNGIRFSSTVGGTNNHIAARSTAVTYPTLAAWTAATARDSNSLSSDPLFTNVLAGDVTPLSFAYNNIAENQTALVPLDLVKAVRGSSPDIGAMEYTPSGCPAPFNVTLANVRANSATINFTSTSAATTIQWGPKGFSPGTGQGANVATQSHSIVGLSGYTAYDVYLAGSCGTQNSVWVGPYSFVTPVQVGWVETFANGYDPLAVVAKPLGWTERNAVAANPTALGTNSSAWMEDGFLNSGTTGAVRNQMPANSVATQGWAITPSIDLGDVSHTTFFEWDMGVTLANGTQAAVMGSDDSLLVLISTNNGSTWNRSQALAKYHRNSGLSPFGGTYSVNLSAYTGLVKIAFYLESLTNSSTQVGTVNYDVFIDNTALKATATPCPAAVLSVTPTTSTAAVSWSVAGVATTPATIAWGPLGFSIGSGGSGANQSTATTNPYTLSGLQQGTTYQVYVQSACAATLGQWAGPITFTTPCNSTLSGSYTIDSNGVGANNFNSLPSALAAINSCGITGPVTFTLAPYTHLGGLNLGMLNGSSAVNTVTFQGPTTGTATIQGVAGQFAAVVLNGTAHVTLRKLRIVHPTASGIIMTAGANNITITENVILADTTATLSTIAGIASSANLTSVTGYGNNANNITVTDNVIKGGYYGVRFNGASTTSFNTGITVSGNQISNSYYYGTYFYYMGNLTINDNKVRNLRNSINYGHYLYYVANVNIQRNESYTSYAGITMGYLNNLLKPASNSIMANNMAAATTSYGAYLPYSRHLNVYHNTFSGSNYGIYLLSSTATLAARNLNVLNNIFKGGTHAYFQSGSVDTIVLDYNLYNSASATTFANYGTAHASLAAWKIAHPTLNANSTDNLAVFMAANDLRVVNSGPNNLGTPIASVPTDIDGDVRSTTTPDLGADEYTPVNNDAKLRALLGADGGCGDSTTLVSVVFENFGINSITSMPATVVVTDANGVATNLTANYTGNLIPGTVDTLVVGSINTYAGGTFNFSGYTSLANDGRTNNDTLHTSGDFGPFEPVVTGIVDTVCASQDSITLFAINVPGTNYGWFASLTDTNIISTGDSLTVPVSGQTSYFVKYMNTADSATTSLAGGNGSAGNMFNIINTSGAPLTITGFAQGPGSGNSSNTSASMVVWYMPAPYVVNNPSWTQLASGTVALTSGAATGYLPVNVTIPAGGTYGFFVGLTAGSVQYTNGTGTAGSSTWFQNDEFIITVGHGGSFPNTTISLRNWNGKVYYGSVGCSEIRKEVSFAVNSDSANAVGTGTETNASTGEFTFDAAGSTGNQFNWNFGDGTSGSGATTVHNYGGPGVFTVTLTVSDTVCGTTDDTTFAVTSSIGLDENALGQTLAAFPNPNTGMFTVRISGASEFEGQLEVLNLMGQLVSATSVDKRSASLDVNLDLSDYAKGIYMVRLSGSEGQAVLRVAVR